MADDVELLIAGGGLNGLLLAIACAGVGLEVALVDREDPAAMLGAAFDGRSSAIAYGSRRVLDGLGLWREIAADAEPIREIRVADGA
ncbi:MAG: FAD-dependent monooxygenase, partial [Stellaceae bacterium]